MAAFLATMFWSSLLASGGGAFAKKVARKLGLGAQHSAVVPSNDGEHPNVARPVKKGLS